MVVKIFVIHPGRYRYPMFRAAGYPAKEEVSGASLIKIPRHLVVEVGYAPRVLGQQLVLDLCFTARSLLLPVQSKENFK